MSTISIRRSRSRTRWQPRAAGAVMLAAAALAMVPAAQAAKAYKWVDEEGNVTYQDSPPPDSARAVEERNIDGAPRAEPGGDRRQQQAAAAEQAPVTLFVVPECAACELMRAHLGRWDVPYEEKSVEDDTENQAELIGLIGRLEIPTLRVGEEIVRGYTTSAINSALAAAGYPAPEGEAPAQGGTAQGEIGQGGTAGGEAAE